MAMGYHWDMDRRSHPYREVQSPDCPESQGAGSIITSVDDLIRWVKCLMYHEQPINSAVYHGLVRTRSFANPGAENLKPFTSPVFCAAGLEVYYYRGHMVVGHDGEIPGFSSRFIFLPDLKFGAVILGNSQGVVHVANEICHQLVDAILKVPLMADSCNQLHGAVKQGEGRERTNNQ
ncbi:hypothetical protein GE09DRAFT_1194602 [Coniochaeta sp. 2T2.1]|nr:hypothetical protein GE09DRAFT_1194602 [Coniochaeta sp. 2T2.1]